MGNCLGKKRACEEFTAPQLEPINRSDNAGNINFLCRFNLSYYNREQIYLIQKHFYQNITNSVGRLRLSNDYHTLQ